MRSSWNWPSSMAARAGNTTAESQAIVSQPEDNTAFDLLCRRRLWENISALEQTVKLINGEQLRQAAELLHSARRVICMGQGSSMVLAEEAWTCFPPSPPSLPLFLIPIFSSTALP